MRPTPSPLPALLLALIIGLPSVALGEFSCSAEISYTWIRDPEPHPSIQSTPAPTPTGAPESTVYVASVSANGATEELAKSAILEPITRGEASALTRCKDEHENQAKCVALKYSSLAQVLNSLGFNARKELEKTIASDCIRSTGRCTGSSASEPTCREIASSDAKGEEGAADAKGKDEKGKDSKKKK